MPEEKTRRSFLAAAGTGVAAALAGCGGNAPDETATESPTDEPAGGSDDTDTEPGTPMAGGTLQMMATGAIQTLDPINAKGSGAGYNQYNQQLMEFPDGEYPPEAALAKDYELSDDGLTYTFTLREDATFHNGEDVTAQDVVYSYRRLAESENSRNKDDIIGETMTIAHEKDQTLAPPEDETTLEDVVPGSLAVEAVDDYTFEMTLQSAFSWTLFQIAGGTFAILPENSVGDVEGYDGEYAYNEFFSTQGDGPTFAGAGAFEVDSWSKGDAITLSEYDDYYGTEPQVDEIVFTVVPDGNARLNRFENGNADILEGMPTASFSPSNVSIEEQDGAKQIGTYDLGGQTVNYGQIPALTTEYLVFNTLEVPIPVRKAFAYALNQHDVAESVFKGTATPAYHIVPPAAYPQFEEDVSASETYTRHAEEGYQSNLEGAADGYPYGYAETDLDSAKQVMEDAGYGPDNTFEITATTISGNSAYQRVFTRLQSKLRQAHIEMDVTEAQFGTIISQAISGSMEVFALGDGMEYPGPENFLRFLWGGSPSTQFTRWGAEGSYHDEELRQTTIDAWQENYAAEDATSESEAEAFQTIEEGNWLSMQELPIVNPASQRFWHTNVDVEMYGVMENQMFTDLTLSR
ncbi:MULTISPECIES: ABC transporter substrate-binding protein [Halolamina]|uniref:Peptide/nickel transport system substrate-binding protein n=1 Tax=Halolamina pelagica TaxID=699431 RepID=A0A1I5MS07_9EURY|nr:MULTISPECIES: ABC transporter substrate-binding protein [Halolamina]NHX36136.1 ABC transporter substrate-binding protein [Halolamina sp. R1-12]SFP12333.1 peptide/nickel transport system substrate-binding protein [Halolamina pelagica]